MDPITYSVLMTIVAAIATCIMIAAILMRDMPFYFWWVVVWPIIVIMLVWK